MRTGSFPARGVASVGLLGLAAPRRVVARGDRGGRGEGEAACASRARAASRPSSVDVETAARPTREIVFRGPGGRKLMGAWAAAARPRGGVLVIHENRGLNDRSVPSPGRLAASGYSALAIDLLSAEGGTGSFADEFEAMAALGAAPRSRFVADMKAGVTGNSPSAPREEGRGDRVLLRWRDDVAVARLEGVAPGRRSAVLRPVPRGREPRGRQGRRARGLCRARLEGQREPPGRAAALRRRGFATRSSRTRASTTRSSTRPAQGTIRPRPRPRIAGWWPGSARTSRLASDARVGCHLCLVAVVAAVAATAAGGTSSTAALSVREYPVPAGSRPHDVAPARDGGVWYTAQGSGELGWLDPKTGQDEARRPRRRLGAARRHRRPRRSAVDHRRRAQRDRPGRPEDAARPPLPAARVVGLRQPEHGRLRPARRPLVHRAERDLRPARSARRQGARLPGAERSRARTGSRRRRRAPSTTRRSRAATSAASTSRAPPSACCSRRRATRARGARGRTRRVGSG